MFADESKAIYVGTYILGKCKQKFCLHEEDALTVNNFQ